MATRLKSSTARVAARCCVRRYPGALSIISLALMATLSVAQALPRLPEVTQDEILAGEYSFDELRQMGEQVFAFPFTRAQGYGDGPVDSLDPLEPPGRPTLQGSPRGGNGTFSRINGLDAQSCLECHSILSADTVPATLAVGGAGGISSTVLFRPKTLDMVDEKGVGYASYDGRVINPPKLFGAGGIEQIAKEMTRNLQRIAVKAMYNPEKWYHLLTHGVHFGKIRYRRQDDCGDMEIPSMAQRQRYWGLINPSLTPPYEHGMGVCPDTSKVKGVDVDLVVKPFGRKGSNFTTRDFDIGAMAFHFGIQPVEVVGEGVDDDEDGVIDEISVGQMSALALFTTTLPRPVAHVDRPGFRRGLFLFKAIGCASCHRPALLSESRYLTLSHPEVPEDPDANVFMTIDLTQPPMNFQPRRRRAGIIVPMYSDLKRHDMGPDLMETLDGASDRENREFITARLWGVADTAPYLHDGRALSLTEAITWHGGEALKARDNFLRLSPRRQQQLLDFLGSLRNPMLGDQAPTTGTALHWQRVEED